MGRERVVVVVVKVVVVGGTEWVRWMTCTTFKSCDKTRSNKVRNLVFFIITHKKHWGRTKSTNPQTHKPTKEQKNNVTHPDPVTHSHTYNFHQIISELEKKVILYKNVHAHTKLTSLLLLHIVLETEWVNVFLADKRFNIMHEPKTPTCIRITFTRKKKHKIMHIRWLNNFYFQKAKCNNINRPRGNANWLNTFLSFQKLY